MKILITKYCQKLLEKVAIVLFAASCGNSIDNQSSIKLIANPIEQDSIFNQLARLTNNAISQEDTNDSLAFLVLPLQVSCPSCRNKTIDSIVKHQNDLPNHHYIILSASGGRKIITSYFLERDSELPDIENKLFIDSIHQGLKHKLFTDNPVIYYTANKKAYKRVSTIPITIRGDLREFFSGGRDQILANKKD